MKRYRIDIAYNAQKKEHTIKLFKENSFLSWKFWGIQLYRTGTPRDIYHYQTAWQKEFNVAPEDINDTRE